MSTAAATGVAKPTVAGATRPAAAVEAGVAGGGGPAAA